MTPTDWLNTNSDELGSEFERLFVLNVLSQILDFKFEVLEAQMPFRDRDGKPRYCDFAIKEGSEIRIAIEVDGYDKRGTGTGMTHHEFVDWQRREAALVSQGWFVLRFANRDVRDDPNRCAEHISLLLRQERRKYEHQNSLRRTVEKLAAELEQKNTYLDSQQQRVSRDRNKIAESEAEYASKLNQQRRQNEAVKKERAKLSHELAAVKSQLAVAEKAEKLDTDETARLAELTTAQKQIEMLKEDASTMKTTIWAGAFIIALVIVALIFKMQSPTTQPQPQPLPQPQPQPQPQPLPQPLPQPQPQPQPPPLGTSCDNPRNWQQAGNFIGQSVAFLGPVIEVSYQARVNGKPTYINMGAAFPDKDRLTLVVWGRNLGKFGSNLENRYEGATACAFGKVQSYKGTVQIELKQPSQLIVR